MKEIPLTQGKVAIVDDDDYEWLSMFKWHVIHHIRKSGKEYCYAATRKKPQRNGKVRKLFMHTEIMRPSKGLVTAHRNFDGLDNRKANLYAGTRSQVLLNKRMALRELPQGTELDKRSKKIRARIGVQNERISLGSFETPEAAEEAYKEARSRICQGDLLNRS